MKTVFIDSVARRAGFVLAALACLDAGAKEWSLRAEAGYAFASGIRDYGATGVPNVFNRNQNDTKHLFVPSLWLRCGLSESWSAELGYSRYDELKGTGISPDSIIFPDEGIGTGVITTYQLSERIHETTAAFKCRGAFSPHWHWTVGPCVSWFASRAHVSYRWFSRNEVRLGGTAALEFQAAQRWTAGFSYRYAAPPDREINLISLTVGFHF